MTNLWPISTLSEICQVKPPKSEVRKLLAESDLVSFVPMECLGIDEKMFIPIEEKPYAEVAGSYTYFADGDVLLAKITPCFENGKLGIAANLTNGIGFGSSEYIVFRPGKSVDKEWLYYFLSQESFRRQGAECMTGAVGHKRVSKAFIESYPIPVPPLPEQQRIVGILDEAFEGIAIAKANAEKNLQNARALYESYLQAAFSQRGEEWTVNPLEKVARIINGFAFKSTDFTSDLGIKTIKIANVGVRDFVCDSGNHLPLDFSVKYSSFCVKQGSIVIALTRTIISGGLKVAVVPDEYDGALLNQRVASIQPDHELVTGPFLFAYLSTQAVADYVTERVNTLMQPNLSITDLRAMPVPAPPVHEQRRISDEIATLRTEAQRLESIYQQKITALESLKKSLLDKAFTGQL
jgi:type I restriction enzyme, S subunit